MPRVLDLLMQGGISAADLSPLDRTTAVRACRCIRAFIFPGSPIVRTVLVAPAVPNANIEQNLALRLKIQQRERDSPAESSHLNMKNL